MNEPKVLFVAFDACDAGLIQELARDGHCPNLAKLLVEGAVVDTVAPYGTYVGASWMTISTGADVGTHRYWNWVEVDPDTYKLRQTTPRESRRAPFWQHVSDSGRRVCAFDVPHADIPKELNGLLLKEWGCHDRHFGTESYPAALLDEINAIAGPHPIGCQSGPHGAEQFAPCDSTHRAGIHRTLDENKQLLTQLLDGVEAKRKASLSLLDREPWDLFMTVLGESHCVGHQMWHLHDAGHPRHDADVRAAIGDPVVQVYSRLDASLGEHLARAGEDTTVWLQFNHGMGPHYDGEHLLDTVLLRIDEASRGPRSVVAQARAAVQSRIEGLIAAAYRRFLNWNPRPAPRPDRRFFQIPGNTAVGAIRLSVVGRESQGLVEPGAHYDAVCEEIKRALLDLRNVETGRPAVHAVIRSESVLERSLDDGLPDLFVEWNREAPISRVASPLIGEVSIRYLKHRTGDHNDRGLAIVKGPGIRPGRRTEPMSLVDVAPTLCAIVGAPLTATDGVVHPDLLTEVER
ncbi:alkaline phosphatase family protein [Smaragdicoccus niigatensis]|uniref:alkaline phosphatase family protein n=1 Tax=Smaragdicoccus niigatensis TaxID=359359 RepID=UPI0003709CEA|nr:alkaline phosphatase family protein [Smaragdicoccus niigatensis]